MEAVVPMLALSESISLADSGALVAWVYLKPK